jgi:hypothetical protein
MERLVELYQLTMDEDELVILSVVFGSLVLAMSGQPCPRITKLPADKVESLSNKIFTLLEANP